MKSLKVKTLQGLFIAFCLTAVLIVFFGSREVGPALTQSEVKSVRNIFQLVDLHVTATYNRLLNDKVAAIEQRKARLQSNSHLGITTFDRLNNSGLGLAKAQQVALDWISQSRSAQAVDWRVIDRQGRYLSHSEAQRIGASAIDVKDLFGRPVAEKLSSGRSGRDSEFAVFINPLKSGKKQLGFFHRFPAWDWTLVQVVDLGDVEIATDQKQRQALEELQASFNQISLPGNGSAFIFNSQRQSLVLPQRGFSDVYLSQLESLENKIIQKVKLAPVVEGEKAFVLVEDKQPGSSALQVYASYSKLFDFYTVVAFPKAAIIQPVTLLLWKLGALVLVIFLVGILLAFFFVNKITNPLLQLAATMREVSETGNYTLRNQPTSNDEIGQLVDGFNDMLTQIELRDIKLEDHKQYLEHAVSERTMKLQETLVSLDSAKKKAEAASQAKSVFLATMTHELRTPLVGIMGMNELLVESQLDEQQRFLAKTVEKSGQELLDLINQILDFSRIETDNLPLCPEPVDLLELVEDVALLLGETAHQKGLSVVVKVAPDAAWQVMVDPQRLRQVLLNLFGNAIKFTDQGYVSIELTCSEKNLFCFKITDTGIGISDQKKDAIFEAFSQIDESRSRVFDGSGLGLSIVRALVELMNGQVRVDSRPDEGSTFEVDLVLPLIKESFIRLPESLHKGTVLLFDPCPATRDAYQYVLSTLGFPSVLVSEDIEGALRKIKSAETDSAPFGLVVLASGCTDAQLDDLASHAEGVCRTLVCLQKSLAEESTRSGALCIYGPALRRKLLQHFLSDSLTVNQAEQKQLESNPAKQESTTVCRNERILVVDDKESTRELMRLSLQRYGLENDEAANAEEVFDAIASQQYGLILMDVNLPGTDGIMITQILREQGLKTPIYAMTAHGEDEVFELCLKSGMQGILQKPFRQKELLMLLENYQRESLK